VVATAVAHTGNSSELIKRSGCRISTLQPLFFFQVKRESIATPTSSRPAW
jgi:hypothetical protein